jgi:hypothetical protein
MASRLKLHEKFCEILGNRNVYFQPPSSVKMQYPAIVYSRNNIETIFANNGAYKQALSYEAILIDRNPDSEYIEKILLLSHCRYERHYEADNLNHDVFTIYDN